MVYIVRIVLEIDPEREGNDYLLEDLLEDMDLGNLEHQAQDSLGNHNKPAVVVRMVNIADKHLPEVVDMLVDL